MRSKLCLALALMVLIVALVAGNPFLVCGPGVPLRAASPEPVSSEAVPLGSVATDASGSPAEPPASPSAIPTALPIADLVVLRTGTESAPDPSIASRQIADAVAFLPTKGAGLVDRNRSEPVRVAAKVPAKVPAKADGELCPDVKLRPLVVRVRLGADGRPIWVLRDGREVQKNPRAGPGQPLVVPVERAALVPGVGADAPGSSKRTGEQAAEHDGR